MKKPSLTWRAVYLIQRLITWFAPPLHSLHWKIFAVLLIGLFLPALYFLSQVRLNIERGHLYSTEQGMIDTALVLADALDANLENLPATREIRRRVFKDLTPDLRVIVYDASGRVIDDTSRIFPPGTLVEERDVQTALKGKYGARWERDHERDTVVLHTTVPFFTEGEVGGAISIVKTTAEVRRSQLRSMKSLAWPALLAFVIAAGASYLLSNYLTRVIMDLASRANRIAAGETGVKLETWTQSELGELARAVETMRRRLEGRAYVEEMASTLSHELKTPLASMRGATEIAESSDSPEVRRKFLNNIRAEIDRLTDIVNNLLALARIESQPPDEEATCRMDEVATECAAVFGTRAEALGLRLHVQIVPGETPLPLAAPELRRVLETLLDNACNFTPAGKNIHLQTTPTSAIVRDEGVGMAPDLRARVFERFFTTVNPLTGRRGTGLGLAIARSIVTRAHGTISLESSPDQGTTVTIRFQSANPHPVPPAFIVNV